MTYITHITHITLNTGHTSRIQAEVLRRFGDAGQSTAVAA